MFLISTMCFCFSSFRRSVVLRNEGTVVGGGTTRHRLAQQVQEGDVIGVAYDHIELRFFLNGVDLQVASPGIKAEEVYPVVYGESTAVSSSSSSFISTIISIII